MQSSSPVTLRRVKLYQEPRHKITLKIEALDYNKAHVEVEKMKNDIEIPDCWIDFLSDMIKFNLEICSQCTVEELAKAIIEVCTLGLEIYSSNFSKITQFLDRIIMKHVDMENS